MFPYSFSTKGVVKRVWMASLIFTVGQAVDLSFTQDSSKVSFTLPADEILGYGCD